MPSFERGFTTQPYEIDANLPVSGRLPDWLEGTLIRNGPGKFEQGEHSYRHWFDGLAMLHSFQIGGGRVQYRNRFLRSLSYMDDNASGRINYRGFAVDPCMSRFKQVFAAFFPSRLGANPVVNVTKLGGEFLALTEAPMPLAFDPHTLTTLGDYQFKDLPDAETATATAHPHYDPAQDAAYNYMLYFGQKQHYQFSRFDGRQHHTLKRIEVKRPAYIHSFAMTPRYLILAEFNLRLPGMKRIMEMAFLQRPFIENFEYEAGEPSRFIVVDRHSGELATIAESDAFFGFHHINAFEVDGAIMVDIAAYDDASLIEGMYLHNLRGDAYPEMVAEFRRYRVPLTSGTATWERISEEGIELPRIHYEQFNGQPYRYAYGIGLAADDRDFTNRIVKIDTQTGDARIWHTPNHYPSEPVFVPAPDTRSEDEGLLLSVVLDGPRGTSYLLVLDALNLEEVARAEAPQHIPFNFHGEFFRNLGGRRSHAGD